MMIKVAVFASGAGSNFKNIIEYFKNNNSIRVSLLVSNNANCGAIAIAKANKIPVVLVSVRVLENAELLASALKDFDIHWIVLAGFLKKIPEEIIRIYPQKIINLHPSLLPKYGGKGMYGSNVHRSVLENNEVETGITIHLVNEFYDEGVILNQFKVEIAENETIKSLAAKIQTLEHAFFPEVVEKTILSIN